MKIFVLIAAALILAGCNTTKGPTLITEKRVVVQVPESLYNCPVIQRLPASIEKLTERQIAQMFTTLYRNNITCKNSEAAIKKYLKSVK
jgi:uncharacterized lipoprotein YajG